MKVLLRKGCSLLSEDLTAVLRRIPAASFRRTLESAFSYMEILVSGVSDSAARRECLKTLLGDWEQFIARELAERDYDAMNALLNGVELTVGVATRRDEQDDAESLLTRFTKSLGDVMSSLLLACSSFQDQCCSIGGGAMVPAFLRWTRCVRSSRFTRSKLLDNVCSKVQTLLDRHKALHKTEKKPVVLADSRLSLRLSRRLRTGRLRLGLLPGLFAGVASPIESPRPSPLPRRLSPGPPSQPRRRRLLPRRQPRAAPGLARWRRADAAAGAAERAAPGDAERRRGVAQRHDDRRRLLARSDVAAEHSRLAPLRRDAAAAAGGVHATHGADDARAHAGRRGHDDARREGVPPAGDAVRVESRRRERHSLAALRACVSRPGHVVR